MKTISGKECAGKIARAQRIAALTGAGMSTAAGVPDFRGPRGLYVTRQYDPEAVFDIRAFDRAPEPFYRFSRDFLGVLDTLAPTFAHRFLASLETPGKTVTILTQNIDGLHQKAGSRAVLPLHGDYETSHCRKCAAAYPLAELRALMERTEVPLCTHCGGVIKPDVVFFGEQVRHIAEAEQRVAASELLLVLGSSLTVYPAAALPLYAGGEVVIVNRGEVGLTGLRNSFSVDADLDEFFREVEASLPAS